MNTKQEALKGRLLDFSLQVISLTKEMTEQREFVLSNQLRKSGTSIGANYYEACHAESGADFVHKLSIALKEAGETIYWIELIEKSNEFPRLMMKYKLLDEAIQLQKIFAAVIVNYKRKSNIRSF